MKSHYVVDTNVLIAASAADPTQLKDIDATPADPALRLEVWKWLNEFSSSEAKLVLDFEEKIIEEYNKKLGYNDYGIQVIVDKLSTSAVEYVNVSYDQNNHAILPSSLAATVHDLSDRKMVASAIEANIHLGDTPIAFAGDTDWHEWEAALTAHGVSLEPIIEAWSRQKYQEKQRRHQR